MLKFIRTVDKSLEDFLVLDLKTLSDLLTSSLKKHVFYN